MNIYSNLKAKQFKLLTIIIALVADGFIAYYLFKTFNDKAEFNKLTGIVMQSINANNPDLASQLPPQFMSELWLVFIQTLISLIALYLAFHIIIYLCHWTNKKFAHGYIKLYGWCGGVMMLLYAITGMTEGFRASFIIPGALLVFMAQGLKHFPYVKNAEE